jgi:dCTP diphosphatase
MADNVTTIAQLKERKAAFVREREWNQHHTPKNLSMSIAIEAAELMEKFQWCQKTEDFTLLAKERDQIEQEVADILAYLLSFANVCNIDLSEAFERKMLINARKYPIEKTKGRSDKYTSYL